MGIATCIQEAPTEPEVRIDQLFYKQDTPTELQSECNPKQAIAINQDSASKVRFVGP